MSTAAKTVPPEAETGVIEGTPTSRPNPVALEESVTVTGARPNGEGGSRDLFSEETSTVLVFKDGAVIRLAAMVSVGQLLFVTNKKNNREVVCQVLHKRCIRPAVCYVELQFTEEKADFWGVEFPNGKTGGGEFKAEEQVQAAETTSAPAGSSISQRTMEDVDQLKKEVDALREQLLVLQKKKAAEAAGKRAAEAPDMRVSNVKPELASANDQSPEAAAPLMPAAKESNEPARAVVGMALPNRKSVPHDPAEELLPRPELDSSQMPESAIHLADDHPNPIFKAKSVDLGRLRVMGLSMVLAVAAGGGAWYGKWWRYLPVGKKATVSAGGNAAKANPGRAPVGKGNAAGSPEAAGGKATGANAAGAPESAGENESRRIAAEAKSTGRTVKATDKKAAVSRKVKTGKAASREDMAASAAEPKVAEPVPNEGPLMPAKLLRAASPVYPPNAMLNYITGDVKAEVEVDASGHVGEVKVVSGPQALRAAAAEALKQYEYAPATQGGKAVASRAKATVKFWFNP